MHDLLVFVINAEKRITLSLIVLLEKSEDAGSVNGFMSKLL